MEKRLLTVNKKILLYIYDRESTTGLKPTQKEISNALDIRRNHVSRGLTTLMVGELIEEQKSHVKGEIRIMKTYNLTTKGLKFAKELLEQLRNEKINIKHNGKTKTTIIGNLRSEFDFKASILDVVRRIENNGFINLEEQPKEKPKEVGSLLHGLKPVRPFIGRKDELNELGNSIVSGDAKLFFIYGAKGIGKSALATQLVPDLSPKMNIFWFAGAEHEGTHELLGTLASFLEGMGEVGLASYLSRNEEMELTEILSLVREDLEDSNSLIVFDGLSELKEDALATAKDIISSLSKAKGVKLMVIARSRESLVDIEDHFSEKELKDLKLKGLDKESAKQLLGKRIKGKEFERIYKLTEGNPLYLKLAKTQSLEAPKGKYTPDELALLKFLKVVEKE